MTTSPIPPKLLFTAILRKAISYPLTLLRVVFLTGLAWTSTLSAQTPATKPNIVLIMLDDLGLEAIRSYGGESYETPRIDRLAESGIRFDQAFANPVCTPSRVKIMTGKHGVRNYTRFAELDRKQRTFAHQLKEIGYATAIAGKWQLGQELDAPAHFGFDQSLLWQLTYEGRYRPGTKLDSRYVNPVLFVDGEMTIYSDGEYGPDLCADFIIDFMADNAREDRPFFAYYPMILPHFPFDPTPLSDTWDPERLGSAERYGPGGREMWHKHTADMVKYADRIVGRIVDKIEELGIRDETLILFTSDNGTDKRITSRWRGRDVTGGKGTITDEGTRVPFIASWPGVIEPGRVSDELIDFSDVLPTIVEVAGGRLPGDRVIDGVSLVPTFQGLDTRDKDYVYVWHNPRGKGADIFARTAEHKVVRRRGERVYRYVHCPGPFEENAIPDSDLTAAQRQAKEQLVMAIKQIEASAKAQ
jgi:arylsulfatase A